MTSDRLFSSKDLGLKYKVVLQLSRLSLVANFPASTITGIEIVIAKTPMTGFVLRLGI